MKKLVNLPISSIEYVQSIAKLVSDKRAKKGNFSRGLNKIIEDHQKYGQTN
jgi:hypothetical protein